jgi:hypothetical protein
MECTRGARVGCMGERLRVGILMVVFLILFPFVIEFSHCVKLTAHLLSVGMNVDDGPDSLCCFSVNLIPYNQDQALFFNLVSSAPKTFGMNRWACSILLFASLAQ